jgi:hypothetical protein
MEKYHLTNSSGMVINLIIIRYIYLSILTHDEIKRVMGVQYYKKYTNEEIKSAFRHFDRDGNGYITPDVCFFNIYLNIQNFK